jgi:hypothetical protein
MSSDSFSFRAKFIARIRNIFLGKLLSDQAYSNYRAENAKTGIYVKYWEDGAIAYEKQAIFQALSDDMWHVTDN